ncbi:MAG: exodeoxyribonuclease VII large subunit [Thiofilum sp.]|uniref:exodeoxyribonuclease VII large subunit n=1 Tax=Thiofilum sp. TaxID=2212733 RepID=UPI0025D90F74|nr:exodeoxyribonuclease VII large subunit [Thiofilum sp.]MBK8454222.1 exodeoxyribonuclease VII large subunit [Thiofilum sp.]
MANDPRLILTVTELNNEVNQLLKQALPTLWVEGEISNLVRASSGHYYFSLKDEKAQLRCALFKGRSLSFKPENGQQVLALGSVGLYEPRGDYQFVVSQLEMAGVGALQIQFEALKRRLNEEGLFASEHKKALPLIPKTIGVITSPTGAAIRDILQVLRRRCPQIPIFIYPVLVQGSLAAEQIVRALAQANHDQRCEVLILARGGGSLEDLWPFNEETVARAIDNSVIPIVTGIGHEIDFTIADFVADRRAPTPSAAAELVGPETAVWFNTVQQWQTRLNRSMTRLLQAQVQALHQLHKRLAPQNPLNQLQQKAQRLDELEQRLAANLVRLVERKGLAFNALHQRLRAQSPTQAMDHAQEQVAQLHQQLQRRMVRYLEQQRAQLQVLAAQLQALSPLGTVARGYALVWTVDQRLVRSVAQVKAADRIEVMVADGQISCEVMEVKESFS